MNDFAITDRLRNWTKGVKTNNSYVSLSTSRYASVTWPFKNRLVPFRDVTNMWQEKVEIAIKNLVQKSGDCFFPRVLLLPTLHTPTNDIYLLLCFYRGKFDVCSNVTGSNCLAVRGLTRCRESSHHNPFDDSINYRKRQPEYPTCHISAIHLPRHFLY